MRPLVESLKEDVYMKKLIKKISYNGVEASLYEIKSADQSWFCGYLGGLKVQTLIALLNGTEEWPEEGPLGDFFPLELTFISDEMLGFDTACHAASNWREDEATDCLLAGMVRFLNLYQKWIADHTIA